VLVSRKQIGAGYRVIAVLRDRRRAPHAGRPRLPAARRAPARTEARAAQVTGNLHWPDEVDGFTPAARCQRNIWFARDVPAMARRWAPSRS
jgi:surfeit locus 1 family protein